MGMLVVVAATARVLLLLMLLLMLLWMLVVVTSRVGGPPATADVQLEPAAGSCFLCCVWEQNTARGCGPTTQ